ncbi:MAG: SDR family oxidoreductase [Desulfatirhabdiaceae bacterium]
MNHTILITGATSGFGESCARKFGAAGWKLILTGRRTDRLHSLQAELSSGSDVHILQLDVRERDAVVSSIHSLPEPFQHIDVLVNNAGLALGMSPAHEADLDDWDIMVDTNIKGLMYCTHAVLPGMVRRKQGHIINLGSIAGTFAYPCGNVYGATKAFVEQFSRNLRSDLLGTPIRVTSIEPGLAQTEFSAVRFKGDIQKANSVYDGCQPLMPGDIADMIFWVASLPKHVNINRLEVMPVCQAWGPLAIHRQMGGNE